MDESTFDPAALRQLKMHTAAYYGQVQPERAHAARERFYINL